MTPTKATQAFFFQFDNVSRVSPSSERIAELWVVWFIDRNMELRYWLVYGNMKNNI